MTDAPPHEIIIVRRRRSGGHDDHHGGVWKIAFADFMTAMMAFFLVLWIVNSTSKETRSSVARYFNPIKLAESTPARKGLQDPKDNEFEDIPQETKHTSKKSEPKAKAAAEKSSNTPTEKLPLQAQNSAADSNQSGAVGAGAGPTPNTLGDAPNEATLSEAALLQNPMAAFSQIVEREAILARSRDSTLNEGFKDPFASLAPTTSASRVSSSQTAFLTNSLPGNVRENPAGTPNTGRGATSARSSNAGARPDEAPGARDGDIQALQNKIASALKDVTNNRGSPRVDIQDTHEGLLISLTDSLDFGMFAIGSAEPRAQTIQAIERIGQALKGNNDMIVVRGHTDSRRYKGGASDNWRLSASRAHMAFYMLMKGGVSEKRLERIEGLADRAPKNIQHPDAAENRRVEILIRRRQDSK